MGVYKKRTDGEEVQTFTCRINVNTYKELKEYAYNQRLSISLAMDNLLVKALKLSENTEEENISITYKWENN